MRGIAGCLESGRWFSLWGNSPLRLREGGEELTVMVKIWRCRAARRERERWEMRAMGKMMEVAILSAAITYVAGSALAETEDANGYTWTYRINGDEAEIYGYFDSATLAFRPSLSPKPNGAVVIPSMLGRKTVKSVGNDAFFQCDKLTAVTIPECVTNFGDSVFAGCSNLRNAVIPEGVTELVNTFN